MNQKWKLDQGKSVVRANIADYSYPHHFLVIPNRISGSHSLFFLIFSIVI